jgi:hypothetical protein
MHHGVKEQGAAFDAAVVVQRLPDMTWTRC